MLENAVIRPKGGLRGRVAFASRAAARFDNIDFSSDPVYASYTLTDR